MNYVTKEESDKLQRRFFPFVAKIGGAFILFIAIPLLALQPSVCDAIDKWFDNIEHQLVALLLSLGAVVYFTLIRRRNF
jgi:Na+/proline symporter